MQTATQRFVHIVLKAKDTMFMCMMKSIMPIREMACVNCYCHLCICTACKQMRKPLIGHRKRKLHLGAHKKRKTQEEQDEIVKNIAAADLRLEHT